MMIFNRIASVQQTDAGVRADRIGAERLAAKAQMVG